MKVGEKLRLRFKLTDPVTNEPKVGLRDVRVLTFLAPGVWQKRQWAESVGDGVYESEITAPQAGVYYVFFECPSLKVSYVQLPHLVLQALDTRPLIKQSRTRGRMRNRQKIIADRRTIMKTKIMPRTHQFRHPLLLCGATALCLFLFGPSISAAGARPRQDQTPQTHDHHKQSGAQDKAAREETVKLSIPDLSLLDQQGRKIRFYSDLVKGKTVAINFIFTTCTTICPPLGATFAKMQKLLGDRLEKDVYLISITVDPVTYTPERLRAWGKSSGLNRVDVCHR